MRICMISEYFYPDSSGGSGPLFSALARSLKDTYPDIELDVITSKNLYRDTGKRPPKKEDWGGIQISRLATPRASSLPAVLRLGANLLYSWGSLFFLLRKRYDLILVTTVPTFAPIASAWFKRLTKTPYVYLIHDLEPDRAVTMKVVSPDHKVGKWLRRSQNNWLHQASKVIVLGRCMRDYIAAHYQLPLTQMEVIPVGADPEKAIQKNTDSQFRKDKSLNGFMVVYGGNFGRYHNFDTVLDAAKSLQMTHKDIVFALVGDGAQKEHIASRISEEAIDNVRLFDFIPSQQYGEVLASADVSLVTLEPGMEGLCVPSKFYGNLASGIPTIALVSPGSEVALVVKEADCGVQIDQSDTERLASVIAELSTNPVRVKQMGENARRVLIDRYANSRLLPLYYRSFQEAIGSQTTKLSMASTTE